MKKRLQIWLAYQHPFNLFPSYGKKPYSQNAWYFRWLFIKIELARWNSDETDDLPF